MELRDPLRDRQAQPGAGLALGERAVALLELFEYPFLILFVDARPPGLLVGGPPEKVQVPSSPKKESK